MRVSKIRLSQCFAVGSLAIIQFLDGTLITESLADDPFTSMNTTIERSKPYTGKECDNEFPEQFRIPRLVCNMKVDPYVAVDPLTDYAFCEAVRRDPTKDTIDEFRCSCFTASPVSCHLVDEPTNEALGTDGLCGGPNFVPEIGLCHEEYDEIPGPHFWSEEVITQSNFYFEAILEKYERQQLFGALPCTALQAKLQKQAVSLCEVSSKIPVPRDLTVRSIPCCGPPAADSR